MFRFACGNDTVSAVAGFYESMEDVKSTFADQRQSWLAVIFATMLLFLGLYALVAAAQTITGQHPT
jgi:hypothetical protein